MEWLPMDFILQGGFGGLGIAIELEGKEGKCQEGGH
jgi:hypothetical protein